MLFLTDRPNDNTLIQKKFSIIQPCILTALHHATTYSTDHALIICDIAFDNQMSIKLLRSVLTIYRSVSNIPILCLMRDPSHIATAQAKALGATTILPYYIPQAQLLSAVKNLIGLNETAPAPRDHGPEFKAAIGEAAAVFSSMFEAARRRDTLSMTMLERGGNAVVAAVGHAGIRTWLDVVWNYDNLTYQHSLLVAGLVASFSSALGLSKKSQSLISLAALVHDIGKAHIPLHILNKPDKLNAAEMAVMKNHPLHGYDMLARQPSIDPRLSEIVRSHHEYLDGSGYPDGLQGNQISDLVRLTTICDIYAALIERRPYKAQIPAPKALSILSSMDGKIDQSLFDQFRKLDLH